MAEKNRLKFRIIIVTYPNFYETDLESLEKIITSNTCFTYIYNMKEFLKFSAFQKLLSNGHNVDKDFYRNLIYEPPLFYSCSDRISRWLTRRLFEESARVRGVDKNLKIIVPTNLIEIDRIDYDDKIGMNIISKTKKFQDIPTNVTKFTQRLLNVFDTKQDEKDAILKSKSVDFFSNFKIVNTKTEKPYSINITIVSKRIAEIMNVIITQNKTISCDKKGKNLIDYSELNENHSQCCFLSCFGLVVYQNNECETYIEKTPNYIVSHVCLPSPK